MLNQPQLDARQLAAESDYLRAFAVRRLGDAAAADDAVQDTFVAALSAPQAWRGEASLRTWLTGILRNKIADAFRDPARRAESLDDAADAIAAVALPAHEQPEARLAASQLVAIADRQLDTMPERSARVFMLTEIGGETDDRVANELGVTSENVSVIRFRARQRLREALAPALAA